VKANTVIVSGNKDWVADPSNYRLCDSLVCNTTKKKVCIQNGDHFLTFNYPNTMTSLIYKPFESINETQVNLSAQAEHPGKNPVMRKR
jgi:hypothetical protein